MSVSKKKKRAYINNKLDLEKEGLMRFLFMSIFFSFLTLVGCSQGDQEKEEMEKIVQLEEEKGSIE